MGSDPPEERGGGAPIGDVPGIAAHPHAGSIPLPASAGQSQIDRPEGLVELNALLGRGTRYTGKLHFDGRVRIEGEFRGEIRGDDVLVIGQGADIDATIEVGACIVTGGTVRANIRAVRAIELHAPALVIGNLHAPNIFIDRGVQFEGKCKMAPLDAVSTPPPPPTDEAVLEPDGKEPVDQG